MTILFFGSPKEGDMSAKNIERLLWGGLILYGIAFFWIFSASGQCSQTTSVFQEHGICLARRLMGLSCFLVLETAFGYAAGIQAKARKYPFIMGFLMGFFLNAIGGFIVMTLSPNIRCPKCGKRTTDEGYLCPDCFWEKTPPKTT